MKEQADPRLAYRIKFLSQAASLMTILLALLVLIGWTLDLRLLTGDHPHPGAMVPNTAFLFVLAGLALRLQVKDETRFLSLALAGFVALAGALFLSEYLFGWNLGIDLLWFQQDMLAMQAPFPGRIAPQAAFGFIFAGAALFALGLETRHGPRPSEGLALLVVVFPYLAILGHAYQIPSLYRIASFIEIAPAIDFTILVLGILFARPESGLMAVISRDSPGGALLRHLLPAALVLPPVLGWLRIEGQRLGLYSTSIGITLMVLSMTILAVVLTCWSAWGIDRVDAERRQKEEVIRKAADEIHDLYNNAPTGYHSLAKDGTFVQINDTELQWLGYAREELVGKKTFADVMTPASQRRFQESFSRFLVQGHIEDLEFDLVRKDGSSLPVLLSASALLDESGQYLMSRSTVFDNTRRKLAEEALRQSRASLAEAQRIAHFGSWEWDLRTNEIQWSDEVYRIFGQDSEVFRVNYDSVLTIVHPDDREKVAKAMEAIRQRGDVYGVDMRILRPDGAERIVHIQGEIRREEADALTCVVGTAQDITALREAETEIARRTAELHQAQELACLKDHFLSTISHEMKTPLSLIAGFTELLEEKYPHEHLLENLKDGSRRLAKHVDNILDYSALLSGSLPLYKTEVDLCEIIQNVVVGMTSEGDFRELQVQVELEPLTPHIHGDGRRLMQAIAELLGNARKFTPAGGTMGIRLFPCQGNVQLEVWDSGPGIPKEGFASVWEGFTQLAVGDALRKGGLGLGLAIVKKITELHGGTVKVESEVGRGSCFTIVLPAAMGSSTQAS